MRSASLYCAVLLAASTAAPAFAEWLPGGTPQSPAPGAMQSCTLGGLAADGSGGAYAILQFQQTLPDFSGTSYALSAQLVDLLGNRPAPWAASGTTFKSWLNSSGFGTSSVELLPLLEDGAGGALVPMVDHQFAVEFINEFRLYHVAANSVVNPVGTLGGLFGGWAVLAAAADGDGAGGAVVIARQQTFGQPPNPPPPGALFVQRVDAAGNSLWPAGGSGAPGQALIPTGQDALGGLAALSDGVGGAFFSWVDLRDAGDPDLYVQHVTASGGIAAGWPAGGVQVCGATGAQSEPHLAPDGAGGVIVVWRDDRDPISHVYANAVLAPGSFAPGIPADGRQLPSSGVDDRLVDMVSDRLGGSFVVRASLTPEFVSLSRLHRLDATMQPRAGWPAEGVPLNTLSPGSGAVGLLPDGLGGAFVSFRSGFGSAAPQGLYAQHFAADGTPAPGWTGDGYRLSGTGLDSRIVRSGAGAIVGWTDYRTPGQTVYAQRLVADGPVPVTLALVSADAREDGVALRWYAAGSAIPVATVERRTEAAAWVALGEVTADGSGHLNFTDRGVTRGMRYGYRLAWRESGAERSAGEVWLEVPLRTGLALEAPSPNPVSGALRLAFSLPDARAAHLDVLDLAGRRVLSREVGSLGSGRHLLRLDEAVALAPGLYTVRLAAGAASRSSRFCVVR